MQCQVHDFVLKTIIYNSNLLLLYVQDLNFITQNKMLHFST